MGIGQKATAVSMALGGMLFLGLGPVYADVTVGTPESGTTTAAPQAPEPADTSSADAAPESSEQQKQVASTEVLSAEDVAQQLRTGSITRVAFDDLSILTQDQACELESEDPFCADVLLAGDVKTDSDGAALGKGEGNEPLKCNEDSTDPACPVSELDCDFNIPNDPDCDDGICTSGDLDDPDCDEVICEDGQIVKPDNPLECMDIDPCDPTPADDDCEEESKIKPCNKGKDRDGSNKDGCGQPNTGVGGQGNNGGGGDNGNGNGENDKRNGGNGENDKRNGGNGENDKRNGGNGENDKGNDNGNGNRNGGNGNGNGNGNRNGGNGNRNGGNGNGNGNRNGGNGNSGVSAAGDGGVVDVRGGPSSGLTVDQPQADGTVPGQVRPEEGACTDSMLCGVTEVVTTTIKPTSSVGGLPDTGASSSTRPLALTGFGMLFGGVLLMRRRPVTGAHRK